MVRSVIVRSPSTAEDAAREYARVKAGGALLRRPEADVESRTATGSENTLSERGDVEEATRPVAGAGPSGVTVVEGAGDTSGTALPTAVPARR